MESEKRHNFILFLKWRATAKPKAWPRSVNSRLFEAPPSSVPDSSLIATFVGHSSFLLQTSGLNILTDPVWSQRVGPWNVFGPKRIASPGISWDALPKIDLVVVSHDHYDHLDLATLEKLWLRDQPVFIVPRGVDGVMRSRRLSIPVETLNWHESKALFNGVRVHLEPVQHWSGRTLWDRGKSLWGAFVIETPAGKIYFAGDAAYGEGEHFRETFAKHGPFRLALLPIGAYEPRWFMKLSHMNPEEAVLTYKELGEPFTLGMHFATFRLSDEGYADPKTDLEKALIKYSISPERFKTLEIGESKLYRS